MQFFTQKNKKRILFWGSYYTYNPTLENYCISSNKNTMDFCGYDCEYSVDQSESSLQESDAIVIHGREE